MQTHQPGLGAAWCGTATSPGQKCWRVSPPAFLLAQLPDDEGCLRVNPVLDLTPSVHHAVPVFPLPLSPPLPNLLWLQLQPPGVFLAEQIIHHSPARLMQALVLCPGVCATFTLISPVTHPFCATEKDLQSVSSRHFSSCISQW